MESVKRQLGDRVWAKTTKQNDKGEVNEDEKMYGLDEAEKEKFINDWRSMNSGLPGIRDLKSKLKAIETFPSSDTPVDRDNVPTQFTVPSFVEAKKNESNSWLDKLKFWK